MLSRKLSKRLHESNSFEVLSYLIKEAVSSFIREPIEFNVVSLWFSRGAPDKGGRTDSTNKVSCAMPEPNHRQSFTKVAVGLICTQPDIFGDFSIINLPSTICQ